MAVKSRPILQRHACIKEIGDLLLRLMSWRLIKDVPHRLTGKTTGIGSRPPVKDKAAEDGWIFSMTVRLHELKDVGPDHH